MDLFDLSQLRNSFLIYLNKIIPRMTLKDISKEELSYLYLPGEAKPEHVPLTDIDIGRYKYL